MILEMYKGIIEAAMDGACTGLEITSVEDLTETLFFVGGLTVGGLMNEVPEDKTKGQIIESLLKVVSNLVEKKRKAYLAKNKNCISSKDTQREKNRCLNWIQFAKAKGETDMNQVHHWIERGGYPNFNEI